MTKLRERYVAKLQFNVATHGLKSDYKSDMQSTVLLGLTRIINWDHLRLFGESQNVFLQTHV